MSDYSDRTTAFLPDGKPNLVGVRRPAGQAHLTTDTYRLCGCLTVRLEPGQDRCPECVAAQARVREELADMRLRQAQRDGMDDSWYEEP